MSPRRLHSAVELCEAVVIVSAVVFFGTVVWLDDALFGPEGWLVS